MQGVRVRASWSCHSNIAFLLLPGVLTAVVAFATATVGSTAFAAVTVVATAVAAVSLDALIFDDGNALIVGVRG